MENHYPVPAGIRKSWAIALVVIGSSSTLQVIAVPDGTLSSIYAPQLDGDAGLESHGVVTLGPYSELAVAWGYHQRADGQLRISLADPNPEFLQSAPASVYVEFGPVELVGNLTIAWIGPSKLQYHDAFEIMLSNAGQDSSVIGQFDTVSGMLQHGGLYLVPKYDVLVQFDSHAVVLVAEFGRDANRDGLVDGADYTAWADNFLHTGQTWTTGDFNGDGVVDGADYTVWADHFAPAQLSFSVVPEPSTVALAGIGAVVLITHGVRRRLRPKDPLSS